MRALYLSVLLAFLGLGLPGCADSSNPLITPTNKVSTLNSIASLTKGNSIIHSAIGSAHWKFLSASLQSRVRFSFSAIQHSTGACTGEIQNNDEGRTFNFHGKVFDLKVTGNTAKFAFKFTSGTSYGRPLGDYYGGDISKLTAWCVVIDNGEGANASGPDVVSMVLWTDGSDIGTGTITGINAMEPQVYLDWMKNYLLPMYGVPYESFLSPLENGSVQVR